jgi:hypothetical protein
MQMQPVNEAAQVACLAGSATDGILSKVVLQTAATPRVAETGEIVAKATTVP